jgi:F-type H+-transporting ATPase subunit a
MIKGILMTADTGDKVDFLTHGVFSYQLFGQTFYITTSHVCLLIVVLILCAFFIIGGNVFRHAKEILAGF